VIPNQLHGILDGATLWPTIKLKAPKMTEFDSKLVRAKITYFDIVKRVTTKDEAAACRTPERWTHLIFNNGVWELWLLGMAA
jgi:hypothetical protein